MKNNNLTKLISSSFILLLGAIAFTSCEDDSLPEAGSIPDLNGPTGAFSIAAGNTSSLVKVFLNTSLSATGGTWFFPEGSGEFISECDALGTLNCSDVVSTDVDQQVYYKFVDFGDYEVGIQASDDLGAVSGLNTATVTVESTEAPIPTVSFEFEEPEGVSNFQRTLTNTSANDDGGIVWTVTSEGEDIDVNSILVADGDLESAFSSFTGQTDISEEIFVSFPGSGDYEVTLTAANFDGVEESLTQTIVVEPLTEPVPVFTVSASSDYTTYTLVNNTPDTDSVIWSLPAGVDFASGTTETDETIEVSFPSSGSYDITLMVTSIGFDDDGNEIPLEGTSTTATTFVSSTAEIATPIIYRPSFEPGTATNPADASSFGTFRNDLGKEWWGADGVSNRVYLFDTLDASGATIEDPTQTIIDTGLENESWFGTASGFNRLNITGSARTGARAASFDPTRTTRLAVQEIDVTPGADYKISFWVSNVSSTAGASLKVFVLDPSVANDTEANTLENRVAGITTENETSLYVEEFVTFNAGDNTSVKLYFYPTDPTAATFYLDDISIAID